MLSAQNSARGIRYIVGIVLLCSLAACGFQLRDNINLPVDMQPLYIQAEDKHSKLGRETRALLIGQGIDVAKHKSSANYILHITDESFNKRTLSVAGGARSAEYQLIQGAEFVLFDKNNTLLLGPIPISERQTLINKLNDVTATKEEEAVLHNEMTQKLALQLLRQLSALTQTQTLSTATPQ